MQNESLKVQAEKVIEQLNDIKKEFIKNKEEIAVSIRKDIISVELKSILKDNKDYVTLKNAIEDYINKLIIGEK